MVLADFNNDGSLDAFVTNNGANTLWWNDGAGTFTDSGLAVGTGDSTGVAVADVNYDGYYDLIITNSGQGKTMRCG